MRNSESQVPPGNLIRYLYEDLSLRTRLATHDSTERQLLRDKDRVLLKHWDSHIIDSADLLLDTDGNMWNAIHESKLPLTPDNLAQFFNEYDAFHPITDQHSLLYVKDSIHLHTGKLLIAYLGPSAGGKDTMLDILMSWYDYITRIKTDTTRKRRKDKREAPQAYNFESHQYLRALETQNSLVEGILQGQDIYATEILEVIKAVRSAHRVTFWRGDIIGYEKFKQFCDLLGLDHVCVVVLPGLTDEDMEQRIVDKRGTDPEQLWRFGKARYELQHFAEIADYIILNSPLPLDKMSMGPVDATHALEHVTLRSIGYEGPLDHHELGL